MRSRKPVGLWVRMPPEVARLLEKLVESQLFGRSVEEVVSSLVREKLRDLIREGWIK